MYNDYYHAGHRDFRRDGWYGRGRPWHGWHHGEPYAPVGVPLSPIGVPLSPIGVPLSLDPRVSWGHFWRMRRVEPPSPPRGILLAPPMRPPVPSFQPPPPMPPPDRPEGPPPSPPSQAAPGGRTGAPPPDQQPPASTGPRRSRGHSQPDAPQSGAPQPGAPQPDARQPDAPQSGAPHDGQEHEFRIERSYSRPLFDFRRGERHWEERDRWQDRRWPWLGQEEMEGEGPPGKVHLSESQLKEWIVKALEGTHAIGSVAEIIEIFHASAPWPAIEASLAGGEAAAVGAGTGALATLTAIAVPVGYVALMAFTAYELYKAFSTGTRIQTKKGYCYGIMWAALGMPNQHRDFQPWGGDSADELREAFEKGLKQGREKFKSDVKLHNQVLLRIAYERMTQKRHGWTDPEGRVLNLLWEQVRGEDNIHTHLNWMPGFIGTEYEEKNDNDLIQGPPRR
jgi:hypothetical protein